MNVPRLLGSTVCPVNRNQISVRIGLLAPSCDTKLCVPLGEASCPSWLVIWLRKLWTVLWVEAADVACAALTAAP